MLNSLKENDPIKAADNRMTGENQNKRCKNGANQRSYAKNPETMNTSKRNQVGGSTLKPISRYDSQSEMRQASQKTGPEREPGTESEPEPEP